MITTVPYLGRNVPTISVMTTVSLLLQKLLSVVPPIELQCLVEQGVIETVESSEWAAPIVPVLKPDGTVQICGDYRLTINCTAKPDIYPLPRVEDLF